MTGNGRATKLQVARTILETYGVPYSDLRGHSKLNKCSFLVNGKKYSDDVTDAMAVAHIANQPAVPVTTVPAACTTP